MPSSIRNRVSGLVLYVLKSRFSVPFSLGQLHMRTDERCTQQNETNSTEAINQYAHGLTYDRFVYFVDYDDDDDDDVVRAICSMISPQTKIINNLNYFTVSFGEFTLCTHSPARPSARLINLTAYENRKKRNTHKQ